MTPLNAHNQDGVWPSSVALVARQAGATVLKFDAYPGEEPDEWAWSNNELPAYKPGGQGVKLDYSVAAASAIGYDAPAISELEDESWIASYHRDPQTVDIAGQVIWDDDDNWDGIRPDSVGVMLWRDGESYMGTRVASAEGGWTYDFDNMPRYEGEGDERHEIRYSFVAGDGGSWTRGSNTTLDFTVKRSRDDGTTFSHFTGIQVDGRDVPRSAYEASAGSVVIRLKPTFLAKLGDGSHAIAAVFDDGSAQANFTMISTSDLPGTLDAIPLALAIAALAAAALIAASAIIRSRTRRNH